MNDNTEDYLSYDEWADWEELMGRIPTRSMYYRYVDARTKHLKENNR